MLRIVQRNQTSLARALLSLKGLNNEVVRHSSKLPMNTGILFVPQQQAWVVERFGKYYTILKPGLNLLIPIVDAIKYVQSLKEIAIEVPEQHAITADNVALSIDGVLYVQVKDPYKASYGVEDPEFAITMLAQTTMRSEIGKIALDTVFKERDSLNILIVNAINNAAEAWGITCLRYEIRNIQLPEKIQEAMQMQVEAERKKRAAILKSEGLRASDINVAEGKKQATILNSEAIKLEQVNRAVGEAEAILAKARAQATSIEMISTALKEQNGMDAVSMRIAEQYVAAFSNLAKAGNTVLLPTNTGDVSSMVSQAMSIYRNLSLQHGSGGGELECGNVSWNNNNTQSRGEAESNQQKHFSEGPVKASNHTIVQDTSSSDGGHTIVQDTSSPDGGVKIYFHEETKKKKD